MAFLLNSYTKPQIDKFTNSFKIGHIAYSSK